MAPGSREPRVVIADGGTLASSEIAEFERDRRELLRRGFGLGGAAIAASSIPLLWSVRNAFAQAENDAPVMQNAITLERISVIAYDSVLAGGLLSPALEGVLRRFRDHEQEHADALTTALTSLGGTPPAPPQGVADVDEVVEGLRDVRSRADVLSFLIELETAAVAAYFDAHAKLGEAKLLQSAATIMAAEGQHLVVLRRAAGQDPLPNAFETGKQ
ncbi:MAG TPA: ferritin-like domain-containing protein [Solirubrobacteraceae bacterium]|nr:ferritin-like domain-containing protein [Solirubrobacteraceae bacterium]